MTEENNKLLLLLYCTTFKSNCLYQGHISTIPADFSGIVVWKNSIFKNTYIFNNK